MARLKLQGEHREIRGLTGIMQSLPLRNSEIPTLSSGLGAQTLSESGPGSAF